MIIDIRVISNKEELLPYLEALKAQKITAIDTETTGLDPYASKLRLIQVACEGLPVFVIDCFTFLPDGYELLAAFINSPGVKIFHNAKFDLQFLYANKLRPRRVFDTMLAAQLLRSSEGGDSASLRAVAYHYLREEVDKDEQLSDWSGQLTESQARYAAKDAEILLRLRAVMVDKIYENNLQRIAEIEFHCVKAVAFMEYSGIYLNVEKWKALTVKKEKLRDAALNKLYEYSGRPAVQTLLWEDEGSEQILGCNFDNNAYVIDLLRRNDITVKSASRSELYPYAGHPLVSAISEYRKASKALSAFLQPFPKMISCDTGRLHAKYGQISAWSGRMSCYSPNVQQIPRESEFRECFSAPPGKKLLTADYSQIELRVAAQIARDERMINAFRNGDDLHLLTASLLQHKPMAEVTKEERQAAKAVNFGLIFGMGAPGLRQSALHSYGVELTQEQATLFRDRFFQAYTGIRRWHNSVKATTPNEGRTLTGRKFLYPQDSPLPVYLNSPVQGSAADIMKKALGLLVERIDMTDTFISAVIHDEILLETPAEKAEEVAAVLKSAMEDAGNSILTLLPVEAVVHISDSWADK